MEHWQKVNPGGETKKALERGEVLVDNAQSPEELQRALEAARTRALNKSESVTMPKNIEEIEFVGLVQTFIAQERKELGLESGYYIALERVRLFHPDIWNSDDRKKGGDRKIPGGKTAGGLYNPSFDTADVKKDISKGPYKHFGALAHELRHQASYFETDPTGNKIRYRSGYFSYAEGTGFGLNEAMTEKPTQDMFESHREIIADHLGVAPQTTSSYEFLEFFGVSKDVYDTYISVVKTIARETDKKLYDGQNKTWDALRRGYFNGDDQAVRDIETVLGPDAFRVFIAMGNRDLFDLEKHKSKYQFANEESSFNALEVWIERYFTNNLRLTEEKRQELLAEILEYLKPPVAFKKDAISNS